MSRVDELVLLRQALEERREISLRQRVERKTRLVEKEDRAMVLALALDEEDQVEAQEPLQARATPFEFDLLGPAVISDPDAEEVSVSLEPEAVVALREG